MNLLAIVAVKEPAVLPGQASVSASGRNCARLNIVFRFVTLVGCELLLSRLYPAGSNGYNRLPQGHARLPFLDSPSAGRYVNQGNSVATTSSHRHNSRFCPSARSH